MASQQSMASPAGECHTVVVGKITVGRITDDVAVLTDDDLHVFRVPLSLLPTAAQPGSLLQCTFALDVNAEHSRDEAIRRTQRTLVDRLNMNAADETRVVAS